MSDIRIYVADLAAYDAGHLHGVWLDATADVSDMRAQVAEMLASSPVPGSDAYGIRVYQGFYGYTLREGADILESAHEVAISIAKSHSRAKSMSTTQTYAVLTCNKDPADADYEDPKTDLTAHDIVRHIYRYDGGDYRLEPKMWSNAPDIQQTADGELVFQVMFKDSGSSLWHTGGWCTATGKTEKEAEAEFLQISFENAMWDTSYWIVLSTEQYLAEKSRQY